MTNSAPPTRPRTLWLIIALALIVGGVLVLLTRTKSSGDSSGLPNVGSPNAGSPNAGSPNAGSPNAGSIAVSGPNGPDTALPAPAPPTEIPASMVFGIVRIGSQCSGATLRVNGEVRPMPKGGLVDIQQLSGQVRLEVRTSNGAGWDTTLTVSSGEVITIGNRPLRCP